MNIPNDLLNEIANYLDIKDLIRFGVSCKNFRKIYKSKIGKIFPILQKMHMILINNIENVCDDLILLNENKLNELNTILDLIIEKYYNQRSCYQPIYYQIHYESKKIGYYYTDHINYDITCIVISLYYKIYYENKIFKKIVSIFDINRINVGLYETTFIFNNNCYFKITPEVGIILYLLNKFVEY